MDHAQKWQCLSLWWWWCFTTVLGVYIIYIYYIYIHLIFGQTQMYTLEIQLTNLIISNGILKSTKLYPIYPMENPSPNPLKDVFRSAKNTSPCCHLAIYVPSLDEHLVKNWVVEFQELGMWLKPTQWKKLSWVIFGAISPWVLKYGGVAQNGKYIYIYIYIYWYIY